MYEKIKGLIAKKGVSEYRVAKDTGIPQSNFTAWKTNKNKPGVEMLQKLSEYFQIPISYFYDENGSTLDNIMPLPTKTYPLVGTIACGTPILATENIEEYITANGDIKADFCLRVKGDSMIGANIFNGNIVFIKEQPTVENKEIAAVLIDDEATLKRFYKENGKITLIAENAEVMPMTFLEEDFVDIKILGKAVAVLREL